jgi:hypothetical protein
MAGWRRTADASDPSRSIRADPDVPAIRHSLIGWSAARSPRLPPAGASGRGVKANTSQAADIAAMSPLQIGLPGWISSSPALASSHADLRLYRPQTFMSKRSSIMTLFQAFTKALTKRL